LWCKRCEKVGRECGGVQGHSAGVHHRSYFHLKGIDTESGCLEEGCVVLEKER